MSHADAVLLLGGGRSTLITGVIAQAFDRPLIAIAYFGGTAETIWRSLVPERDVPTQNAIDDMAAEPDEARAHRLVASLADQERVRRSQVRERSGIMYACVSVALLVAWISTLPIGYVLLEHPRTEEAANGPPAFLFLSTRVIQKIGAHSNAQLVVVPTLSAANGSWRFEVAFRNPQTGLTVDTREVVRPSMRPCKI